MKLTKPYLFFFIFALSLFTFSLSFAQELNKSTTKKGHRLNSVNGTKGVQAQSDVFLIKNDQYEIIQIIEEENSAASILLFDRNDFNGIPKKLYNNDGNLFWGTEKISVGGYAIGDYAHGGIVFWVDETGEHGLVCAIEDQSSGVRWHGGTTGFTRARGDGPFSGKMNTNIIISSTILLGDDGNSFAASICSELQVEVSAIPYISYGDWSLPSTKELNLIHQNKVAINNACIANGGSALTNAYYWSSTENSTNGIYAIAVTLVSGASNGNSLKTNLYRVRAVRAF